MQRNGFVKSHALGNDYIVMDPQALSFPLTPQAIRMICDRHMGVGSAGVLTITGDRGMAPFRSDRIPVAGPPRDVVDEALEVDGQRLVITAVSMGNPHCVVFVPDLAAVDLHPPGPNWGVNPAFPRGPT